MSETLQAQPEIPDERINYAFSRIALGVDRFEDPLAPPDTYHEFREIGRDVERAVDTMRDDMWRAATTAGVDVDPEAAANWRPSTPQEIEQLRQRLRPQRKRVNMINGLIDLHDDKVREAKDRGVPLRKHQFRFTDRTRDFALHAPRKEGALGKSGIIEAPPGVGKTAIFSKITSALKYGEEEKDPVRVVILVRTQEIRNQTMGHYGERGLGKFAPHLEVGEYPPEPDALDKEVVVMCFASFLKLMQAGKMPDSDAVIVDEVDTAMGDLTKSLLEEYMSDKIGLGLTATAVEAQGDKSVYTLFEHKIDNMKTPEAIKAGFLAPSQGFVHDVKAEIDWNSLPNSPAERRRAIRLARLRANFDYAKGLIKEAVEEGLGVMVCCPPGDDIGHAINFAAEIRDIMIKHEQGMISGVRWVMAAAVGGSTKRQTKDDRRIIMDAFAEGRVDVITYVKAVGRGADTRAKVSIDLVGGPAAEVVQRHGRATRLAFDHSGKPIGARLHDFKNPDLGDNGQFTSLNMLGTEKSGDIVDHDPVEMTEPRKRRPRMPVAQPEIIGISSTLVGTVAVDHQVEVEPPSAEEIETSMAILAEKKPKLSVTEAADILGVSRTTMQGILKDVDLPTSQPIDTEYLPIILEYFPLLKAPILPETGYTSIVDAARLVNSRGNVRSHVRAAMLMQHVRNMPDSARLFPRRFIDRETSRANFYFSNETLETVIASFEQSRAGSIRTRA